MEIFNQEGLAFAMRWLHVLAGITWIGLLYYFNFVQVPAFAGFGEEGRARNIAIDKVARRALWWFRWAAMATLVLGLLIIGVTENYMQGFMSEDSAYSLPHNSAILVGMLFGITMAANVWMVIWPAQRVVLANAVNVLGGGEADPAAPGAGRKALLASRMNTIYSLSMLFFMVGASHFFGPLFDGNSSGKAWTFVIIAVVIGAIFELLALGMIGGPAATNKLLWPFESHKNAIYTSIGLWVVLYILTEIFLKA